MDPLSVWLHNQAKALIHSVPLTAAAIIRRWVAAGASSLQLAVGSQQIGPVTPIQTSFSQCRLGFSMSTALHEAFRRQLPPSSNSGTQQVCFEFVPSPSGTADSGVAVVRVSLLGHAVDTEQVGLCSVPTSPHVVALPL